MTKKHSDTQSSSTFCRKKLTLVINAAVSAFFPNTCAVCKRPLSGDEYFCDYCYEMLSHTESNKLCIRCGSVKKDCRCSQYIFVFDGCTAPFTNGDVAKRAMYNFKFRRKQYIGEIFARQMALSVMQNFNGVGFDAVCYVPLEKRKELRRGYNQSYILAKRLAEILEIPLCENALSARKKKFIQHKVSFKDRFDNVRGIYYTNFRLDGKKVLLVDDIKTSGATLNECAKQLLISGADSVYCVTGLTTVRKKGKTDGN